jgi:ElaB/YqjD/DUF883 family membrane-anchored ribosome-binding protein
MQITYEKPESIIESELELKEKKLRLHVTQRKLKDVVQSLSKNEPKLKEELESLSSSHTILTRRLNKITDELEKVKKEIEDLKSSIQTKRKLIATYGQPVIHDHNYLKSLGVLIIIGIICYLYPYAFIFFSIVLPIFFLIIYSIHQARQKKLVPEEHDLYLLEQTLKRKLIVCDDLTQTKQTYEKDHEPMIRRVDEIKEVLNLLKGYSTDLDDTTEYINLINHTISY